ncbi:MAG: hypothetical protein RIT27_1630 [Pseudomonadota bacterium]|jgi:heme oxygenase
MKSLSEQLKVATWLQHEKLEQLPFGFYLKNGTLPLVGYISQLQAYYLIYHTLEEVCRSCEQPPISLLWEETLVKTPLLKADLKALDASCMEEMPATQPLVNFISRASSIELAGILYVFEGSTMGAIAMYPTICRAYQLQEQGVQFFYGYGKQTYYHWKAFKNRFDEVLKKDIMAQQQVIASAQTTFEEVAVLFTSLWDNIRR